MFEQDDVENFASITQMAKGQMAERLNLNNRMGLGRDGAPLVAPLDWPGPGRAYKGFGEYNQRDFLSLWCDYLADGAAGNGRPAGGPVPRAASID
jgi:hypothetical protein